MMADRSVDLLYLACNRREFTQETFTTLLSSTDWRYVHELFVYDDGSQDGTREWLEENAGRAPVPTQVVRSNFSSPVAAMVHFIESASAPLLAKTDNDTMLPPGWLAESLGVMDRHPELSLLGIEAMYPGGGEVRSYVPAVFISGLGLYRRVAFAGSRPVAYNKWFGLEEWQVAQGPGLVRGWIKPALAVFLLDRCPFDPWKSYSDDYIRRGWQRSWPRYDPDCGLWNWRWPKDGINEKPTHVLPSGDPRFWGAMRIKNEGQHIEEVLSRAMHLCQRVLVFDDHSTDGTRKICASFGERVTVIPSPFEGLDEVRDKNYLLQKILATNPEWVLWIDGDEVLEQAGPEKLKLAAHNGSRVGAYSLRVAYLWNDFQSVRVDGLYGRLWRPSFFRLKGQPMHQLHFRASGRGGNFHCGNVPQGIQGEVRLLDVRLKHYGYVTREQRQAKYRWYSSIDPNNSVEDNYRHLAEIPGARWAPGPPRIIPWKE